MTQTLFAGAEFVGQVAERRRLVFQKTFAVDGVGYVEDLYQTEPPLSRIERFDDSLVFDRAATLATRIAMIERKQHWI